MAERSPGVFDKAVAGAMMLAIIAVFVAKGDQPAAAIKALAGAVSKMIAGVLQPGGGSS